MKPHPVIPPTEDDSRLLRAAQEYLAALEAGQRPDRAAFLARFPDVGAELGPYLDTLDAVHAARPGLPPLTGKKREPAGADLPNEPLGDFRIVGEIGRGGMGVVYEAVQLSLGRRVALKVLPLAAALDAKQLQRFKNEAQAAAQLHHPNIVPVYYVGVERGVHFYAMQFIEGQNLAAVVEEMRATFTPSPASRHTHVRPGVSTEPYNPGELPPPVETRPLRAGALSTQRSERPADFFRSVARLVAQAATGLAHAHSVGIVHRDVKPANLLVDALGTLWITDFGLAQFHTEGSLTQTGDLLGTLRYMSPEQAGGQRVLIDHRTDVYSLGATLYELLTLRPIFDGADRQKLLHQILNDEPQAPRTIDRTIPSELETIVLKATAKAPSDRYATAQDLADDLERFLKDQPIRARRPSLIDKATKWARRHRGMVLSAVLALIVSLAGLSVATALTAWAYEREAQKAREADEQRTLAEENLLKAEQHRREAVANLAEADRQRLQAVESLHQARRAVDLLTQISEEELAGKPGVEVLRKRLLEVALGYYHEFISQRSDDPMLQAELEVSRSKAETILRELTTLISARDYGLLRQPSVQKELKVTPAQQKVLAGNDERWRQAFGDLGRLTGEARDRRFLALAQAQEEDVNRLLDPAQARRFKQLAVQHLGLRAFSDPDIAATLGLTAEQKRLVRDIQDEASSGRFGPPWNPGPEHRKNQEQAHGKILALLTPPQREKWKSLTGDPFTFDPPRRPPGPRP